MHNQKYHSAMKNTPFFLTMGSHPKAIPTVYKKMNVPAAGQWLAELGNVHREALASHELSRQMMIARNARSFSPFKEGEKVWLESRNLKMGYPTKKLAPRREGPFTIKRVVSKLVYELELPPPQWKIHPVFHASLLTKYKENDIHGLNFLKPPPDLIEGELEHEVESILSHKGKGKGRSFLIKWKGYPTSENTWEPERNLKNAPELLKEYKMHRIFTLLLENPSTHSKLPLKEDSSPQ
jgi:Chromo (CHRromatin Organisation MOdifier) domain